MIRAHPLWRAGGGATIEAHCYVRAKGAMLDHYRRVTGWSKTTRTAPPPPWSLLDDDVAAFADPNDPIGAVLDRLTTTHRLQQALAAATPAQRAALHLVAAGNTQRETAVALGVTESCVSHHLRDVRRRIT